MAHFSWPIRVYYEDTDAGGVVFYANYLKFLERARTEMLRAEGFEQDVLLAQSQVLFVVRSLSIDYLAAAKFNQLLMVESQITLIKRASLVFEQVIKCADNVLCKAQVCIACVDAQTFRPKAIPANLKATFSTID